MFSLGYRQKQLPKFFSFLLLLGVANMIDDIINKDLK